MNWREVSPGEVLKWAGVGFIVVLQVLFVVAIVLSMVGVWG